MQIPELQRPFAWGATEARELCRDIEKLLESLESGQEKPQHFFGILVVLASQAQPDDIIDGQQRMTTATLLLGRIESAFRDLRERCIAIADANQGNLAVVEHHKNIADSASHIATSVNSLIWLSTDVSDSGSVIWEPRLRVSPEIKETYLSLLAGGNGEVAGEVNQPASNLREVARVFDNRLISYDKYDDLEPREQLQHLNSVLKIVKEGLILVRLETSRYYAGYELFETLNARGIKLNVLDHLKVWMLAVFAEHDLDQVELARIMRGLSDDNVEQQVDFFEDFFVARTQDTTKHDGLNNPKHLVMEARRYIFLDPTQPGAIRDSLALPQRILHEAKYMETLSPIWRRLKKLDGSSGRLPQAFVGASDAPWVESRMELLLGPTLRHQAAYPFLMVAADCLRDQVAVFGDLIHRIELFFFRFRTICGGSEKKIVDAYKKFLRSIDANSDLSLELVKRTFQDLLDEEAADALFTAKLIEKLNYADATSRLRTKYFFEMVDNYSYEQKPMKRLGHLDLSKWHLEHIVPQNPADGDPTLPEDEIGSLGNLCLLPPKINTSLSNLNFGAKQAKAIAMRDDPDVAKRKAINITDSAKIFYGSSGSEWTSSDVATRIESLQDLACQIFKM